jgi:peptidoglycan/xylan/chitin deacetylase (PgdA/CDA1 family)
VADRLLIFAWHNVEATWYHPAPPGAGVRGLADQLKRIKLFANVVSLASALDNLAHGRPLPPRAVALAFDDGYLDNLQLAVPLLEKFDLPATFFLVPGLLSREVSPWWETLAWAFTSSPKTEVTWAGRPLRTRGRAGQQSFLWAAERLKTLDRIASEQAMAELLELLEPQGTPPDLRELFLGWDGAGQLVRHGFAVGSHTMRHAVLSREAPEKQAWELAASRAQLEAELDIPVELVAYPSGTRADYDLGTIDAARDAGYRYGLAAHAGICSRPTLPYAVPRFMMQPHRGFSETLARRVAGRLKRTDVSGTDQVNA